MRKNILIYSPSISSFILFKDIICSEKKYLDLIIELPNLPKKGTEEKTNKKLLKKIFKSSYRYVFFNLVFLYLFSILSKISGNRICNYAKKRNIKYFRFKYISKSMIDEIKLIKPAYIFNASGFILRRAVLDLPRIGVVNFHGAPLPMYRGAANYFWLLIDEVRSPHGVLHYVESSLDTGDVIAQTKPVRISSGQSAGKLYLDILYAGRQLLLERMQEFMSGTVSAKPQNGTAQTRSFPQRSDMKTLRSLGYHVLTFADVRRIVSIAITGRL